MPSIADALGIDYHGAQANVSHVGRATFGYKAVTEAFQIPSPMTRNPKPSIADMLSKGATGFPGDNLDIFA